MTDSASAAASWLEEGYGLAVTTEPWELDERQAEHRDTYRERFRPAVGRLFTIKKDIELDESQFLFFGASWPEPRRYQNLDN